MKRNKVRCIDCEFWERMNKIQGECREDSAQLDPRGYGAWPITKPSDGCYAGQARNILLTEDEIKIMEDPENNIEDLTI